MTTIHTATALSVVSHSKPLRIDKISQEGLSIFCQKCSSKIVLNGTPNKDQLEITKSTMHLRNP